MELILEYTPKTQHIPSPKVEATRPHVVLHGEVKFGNLYVNCLEIDHMV